MTRRLPIIRSLVAPADMFAAVVAAFPGAILLVDGNGLVTNAWANPLSPMRLDGAVGRPIHALLALPDDAPAAGQLQLWLACAVGVDSEMFQLSLGDPPRHLSAVVGRAALELDYGPVFDSFGITTSVAMFVKTAAHEQAARPADVEVASPEQVERFFVEIQPLLEDCNAGLVKLESDYEARHSVHRMFRAIHTVKSAASTAGLGPIADVAHELENRLAELREPGHQLCREELAVVRELLGQLGQQILVDAPLDAAVDAMASLYGAYRPLMARAEEAFTAWQLRMRDSELGAAFQRALRQLGDIVEPFRMHALAARLATILRLTEAARSTARPERRLLADIDQQLARLHEHVDLYQDVYRDLRACDNPTRVLRELASLRRDSHGSLALQALAAREGLATLAKACGTQSAIDHVASLLEDLPRMFAPAPASLGARASLATAQRTLVEAAAALKRIGGQLPEVAPIAAAIAGTAERLTWMGVDELVRRARRQATTLAIELGKQVELDVDAFSVVVPEAVHRVIGEVLLHAIRNAVDHGLETVDERRAAGKPASGTISVVVVATADRVELEIVDDGRGVDLERVRAKAIANQLIDASAGLSPSQLHELIFHPGLSTVDRVSQVSGRGVGMDVIRSLAEALGGTADVSSEQGRWTRLVVRMPLASESRALQAVEWS